MNIVPQLEASGGAGLPQLELLSYLLWAAQGVRRITHNHTLRTVPSADARHAFETYMYAAPVGHV